MRTCWGSGDPAAAWPKAASVGYRVRTATPDVDLRSRTLFAKAAVVVAGVVSFATACSETKAPVLEPLAISPAAATLRVGETVQFNAGATSEVVWRSSDPAKLSISESGLAAALAAGVATISAIRGDETVSAMVTIMGCNLLAPTIAPPNAALLPGDSALFQVRMELSCGPQGSGAVTWTTSDPALATVEPRDPVAGWQAAMVRARAVGQVLVRASMTDDPTISAAAALTIRAP